MKLLTKSAVERAAVCVSCVFVVLALSVWATSRFRTVLETEAMIQRIKEILEHPATIFSSRNGFGQQPVQCVEESRQRFPRPCGRVDECVVP